MESSRPSCLKLLKRRVRILRVNGEIVLVLASNSPRRRQLLARGNWAFSVKVVDIDETPLADELPKNYVLRLARAKALAVSEKASPENIIIGSDTTVVDGDSILGKPNDARDAESMLKQLRGRTHQVYTGLRSTACGMGRC